MHSDHKCAKGIPGAWFGATKIGPPCGTGNLWDPRNGGECWSCPNGFNRTIEWRVVGRLATGSLPATVLSLYALSLMPVGSGGASQVTAVDPLQLSGEPDGATVVLAAVGDTEDRP